MRGTFHVTAGHPRLQWRGCSPCLGAIVGQRGLWQRGAFVALQRDGGEKWQERLGPTVCQSLTQTGSFQTPHKKTFRAPDLGN